MSSSSLAAVSDGSSRFKVMPRLLAVALWAWILSARGASADPAPLPRLGLFADGPIRAAAVLGHTLFVGGSFGRIASSSGALGAFYALSPSTGAPTGTFPFVDGTVDAIESDGGGGFYIGGRFSTVNGEALANLAHIRSDGTADDEFQPQVDGRVTSIARGAGVIVIIGSFTSVGGVARAGLAAVDAASGAVTSWNPQLSDARDCAVAGDRVIVAGGRGAAAVSLATGTLLWSQLLAPDLPFQPPITPSVSTVIVVGSRVFVGGQFLVPSTNIWSLVALDLISGSIDQAWVPNGSGGVVEVLAEAEGTLYVGGRFASLGGASRNGLAAVDIASATVTSWNPQLFGTVHAMAASSTGTVYVGGEFWSVNGQRRANLVEIDASQALTSWIPEAFSEGVRAIHAGAGQVVIGGSSATPGGAVRRNLAALDLTTGALLDWAPSSELEVLHLAAAGSTLFVAGYPPETGRVGFDRFMGIDAVSGDVLWRDAGIEGIAEDMLVDRGYLYVAGGFRSRNSPGSVPGLARIDALTGLVDFGWVPRLDISARFMTVHGRALYVVGPIAGTGPVASGLAAVDLDSAAVASSPAEISGYVASLTADAATVFVGGSFASIGSQPRPGLGGIDVQTGLPTSWSPASSVDGGIGDVTLADGHLIVSGIFTALGGRPRFGLGAMSTTGETLNWNPVPEPRPLPFTSPTLLTSGEHLIVTGISPLTANLLETSVAVFALLGLARPSNLEASVDGREVVLRWDAPAGPTPAGYVIETGSGSGRADVATLVSRGLATSYATIAPDGTYFVRVRAAPTAQGPLTDASNEVVVLVGCRASPPSVLLSAAKVEGAHVSLDWAQPLANVTQYRLEVGSAPGARNLGTFRVPAKETRLSTDAPAATYFARLFAENDCGVGSASDEIVVAVGPREGPPGRPTGLGAVAYRSRVGLWWTPPATPVLGFVVEAGSARGLRDLAVLRVGPTTSFFATGVPRRTYWVRVRAVTSEGIGPVSAELRLPVP
jgi:hypothetical protein